MKTALAEKLLFKIMQWDSRKISQERPLLQALSNFKYDEYQQFSIGTRFIESLVKWLNNFKEGEEREIAYNYVKNRLIFISNDQMLHLVSLTFSDLINPFLIKKTAVMLNLDNHKVRKIVNSIEYKNNLRKSLFIGLSDGSRIDQLRRFNSLNNEQVIPTYQINQEKVDDMIKELSETDAGDKFNTVFLIDDFTASGTSYFRFEGEQKKGKIFKAINSLIEKKGTKSELCDLINHNDEIDIYIIFYIATRESIDKLKKEITIWQNQIPGKFKFEISAIQILEEDIKINEENDNDFIELSKQYINNKIVDKHFLKAKNEKYYLGYNECGLPLVLVHNTPNNSLPLLWWTPDDENFCGLFPRVTRHR